MIYNATRSGNENSKGSTDEKGSLTTTGGETSGKTEGGGTGKTKGETQGGETAGSGSSSGPSSIGSTK